MARFASRLCLSRRLVALVASGCFMVLARLLLFGDKTIKIDRTAFWSQGRLFYQPPDKRGGSVSEGLVTPLNSLFSLPKGMNDVANGILMSASRKKGQYNELRIDNAKMEANLDVRSSGKANTDGFSTQTFLIKPSTKRHNNVEAGPTQIGSFSHLDGFQFQRSSWLDGETSQKPLLVDNIVGNSNDEKSLQIIKLSRDSGQLIDVPWPTASEGKLVRINKTLKEAFRPLLSAKKKAALFHCLRFLSDRLNEKKVTYFLYSGSLLGAHRHRGMIPWDDDVDIIANFSQASEVAKALKGSQSCKLLLEKNYRYKLYPVRGDPIPRRQWRWPFIDIFFFNETATHLYDVEPMPDGVYSFKKSDVFPLIYKPFDGIRMPVPAEEKKVIALDFHEDLCKTGYYSHRYEMDIPDEEVFSVPCKKLYNIHPFVFRSREGNSTKELLKVGSVVLKEYIY